METENIKLKTHGENNFIASPSGKKITASTLEVGKTYLNKNLIFLRTIIAIVGNDVQYLDLPIEGYGFCSKTQFAKVCPNEATTAEIDFIMTGKKIKY